SAYSSREKLCVPLCRPYNKNPFGEPARHGDPPRILRGETAINRTAMSNHKDSATTAAEVGLTLSAGGKRASLAPTQNEWRIIGLTSVGHTLCHISELVFAGALATLMVEFQLQPDQVTLLGLSGYVLMGLGAVPTGLWTDRWGARRVLMVYFF